MTLAKTCLQSALLLAAVGGLTAFAADNPGTANLTAGLNDYLAQRGTLCLDKTQWPIDVTPEEFSNRERNAQQMPVLEKLGLVSASNARVKRTEGDASTWVDVKRYALTAEGRKYYWPRTIAMQGKPARQVKDLCVGRLSLDRITKWGQPSQGDGKPQIAVSYTYKMQPAEWVKADLARKTFPMVARIVDGAGTMEMEENFVLTPNGWKAQDLVQ